MVRDKKNSLLTKLKNEAVESRVKNFLLPFETCALSSYPVHPGKRNSSKREEGGRGGGPTNGS